MGKRSAGGGGNGDDKKPSKKQKSSRPANLANTKSVSSVKNKQSRSELASKCRQDSKRAKSKRRRERQKQDQRARDRGEVPEKRQTPRTIDAAADEIDEKVELANVPADDLLDRTSEALEGGGAPESRVASNGSALVTTSRRPSGRIHVLLADIFAAIPNLTYVKRNNMRVCEVVQYAREKQFTSVILLNEDRHFSKGANVNTLTWIKLPEGPTAHFKMSGVQTRSAISSAGRPTSHKPELIVNGFKTSLGARIARILGDVFPKAPQAHGRRVVTFHSQRDFIFFRHHRYIFEVRGDQQGEVPSKHEGHLHGKEEGSHLGPNSRTQCTLQEIGPRFTLKLMRINEGAFGGSSVEWARPPDKSAPAASRRTFYYN